MITTFTLPFPPSVNNLYATVMGRKVLSKRGREYHAEVATAMVRQQYLRFGAQRVGYRVTVFPPDRRRRDLSNLVKAMEDALTNAGLWDDDSQVDDLQLVRSHVAKGGSLYVEAWSIEQQDTEIPNTAQVGLLENA